MTGTTMVVAIVFISVGFSVIGAMFKRHMDFKEKLLEQNTNTDDEKNSLAQNVSLLEDRIKVLEKIVTDEGYSVQKDINNL